MRTLIVRSSVLLAAALAALPATSRAQAARDAHGFFIGAGGGLGRTSEPASDVANVGFMAHLHTGWRFSPAVALMLESSFNTANDKNVDSATVIVEGPSGSSELPSRRVKLGTQSLLLSLQLGTTQTLYVRPGVGFAGHSFGSYRQRDGDVLISQTSHEWGPAASIAVGRELPIPGFPLNVEAVALYSRGEDSTPARWSAGVQIVREIQF
ncbi:hypothetical protein [Longimicrobium sp.]|uniref:hypothetical protein n=1 Tax=Longimicrobium sp. TaxID=2029185 RepID=UPI002C7BBE9D|nr:hypothetical protein [Longimicrobium sp.]HSU14685.1 hypothetical protein [Longimicrobium sp.]